MSIIQLQRGIRETGRIRIGQQVPTKGGKTRPEKLETFRLTSPDRRRIEQAAERYGGEVAEWAAPAGKQWEVITETDELEVLVPPEQLAFSQWYELWSAGGCQRRCNGATETLSGSSCLCDPEARECDIHTRLSVLLRELPGLGVWRLDTQGYYAAVELSGALQIVQMAVGAGSLLPARLRLEQRSVKRNRQTLRFAVPALDVEVTPAALLAGQAKVHRLGQAAVPQLETAERPALTPVPPSDEPVPSIAAQSQPPEARPRRRNSAPELPSSGRSRRARAAAPEPQPERSEEAVAAASGADSAPVEPEAGGSPAAAPPARRPRTGSRAADPALQSADGDPDGHGDPQPPTRPRRRSQPAQEPDEPAFDLRYWQNRIHAAAGERGIDHAGLRAIAAAILGIDPAEVEGFTSNDLVEAEFQAIDSVLRGLPEQITGEDPDADLNALSAWVWPRATAKALDSWDAIDAVAVAITGKQPDDLDLVEWITFVLRLERGEYDAKGAA